MRPAKIFAMTAMQFTSQVTVICHELRVDAKSTIDLMTLGAAQGTELVLEAQGDDAQQAVDALAELVNSGFPKDLEPTEEPQRPEP